MSEYKDTVFLPKTTFSMRAGLPKKEPEILKFWQDIDIYSKLRSARKGRELFVLHDGPPYANGCLLYTSPSPRDVSTSRMPSSA